MVAGGVCYWRERGKEAGHVRNISVSAYGRVHTQVCRVVIQYSHGEQREYIQASIQARSK